MARKRKSDVIHLDEVDRTLYSTFCSAANSLSQLYTQAMNHQKVSFQAGERHALEKLYQWIIKRHEEGSRVMTTADIVEHIEKEIDYGGDDAVISARLHFQQQLCQSAPHLANSPGFAGLNTHGVPPRTSHFEQVKNSVFSNALSSPVHRSLQPHNLTQGEGPCAHGGTRECNSLCPNDSSMEMH